MRKFSKRTKIALVAVTALIAAVAAVFGANRAGAITIGGGPATHVNGCVVGQQRILENGFVNSTPNCGNSTPFSLGALRGPVGPPGAKGDTGPAGETGPQGPSGVQALVTKDFAETDGIVTGGSFVSLSTEIGTFDIPAGTYQVCVNGKVEQPTASTGQLSAQLFLYDQAKNADFTGDLLNVSADPQGGTKHDAYLNGCTLITESAAATLHLYGFGYDADSGAGAFNLMSATVSLIQLTPAA